MPDVSSPLVAVAVAVGVGVGVGVKVGVALAGVIVPVAVGPGDGVADKNTVDTGVGDCNSGRLGNRQRTGPQGSP